MSAAVSAFSLFACWSAGFAALFSLASAAAAWRLLRRSGAPAAPGGLPPVTVLKPLRGADPALQANLESFFLQDHPCFQLVFCPASPDDPAIALVAALRRRHPGVDAELVIPTGPPALAPAEALAAAFDCAKYDLLLVSDPEVRADPGFLGRMAAPFADPGAGAATAFYRAEEGRGAWGRLEELSVNAQFLPQALFAASFGMRFAMGAALMVRRAALEAAGGFAALADAPAADHRLGRAVEEAGWRLVMAPAAVATAAHPRSPSAHLSGLARWARSIRSCRPAAFAASGVQHGFSWLTLLALLRGPDAAALAGLGALWACKAASASAIAALLGARQSPASLLLLPASEWLAFAAWAAAFLPEPRPRLRRAAARP